MVITEGMEERLNQLLNDPESMAQIMSFAQSLGGKPEEQRPKEEPAAFPDEGFVRAMLQLVQQAQHSDGKQEALLCALKPFLRPERRDKIDRALRIARLSQLAGSALKNYGGLSALLEG